jgi:AraC family transcriptional regulator
VSLLGPHSAAAIDRSIGVSPTLSPVVKRAQLYIGSHIREPLRLATIARFARCSRRHLCARFPLETGQTVGVHIRSVRLQLAVNEIHSGVKIVAVAHGIGYQSYGNFVRLFRQMLGVYPRAFRPPLARSERGFDARRAGGSRE